MEIEKRRNEVLVNGVDALGAPHRFSKIFPCRKIIICFGWRGIAADINGSAISLHSVLLTVAVPSLRK